MRLCSGRFAVCLLLVIANSGRGPARACESSCEASPNVIIIFADDQGYQDLGCYGSPDIKTPNIDRLAAGGVRFTSFYSAYCVCSASRAALMTGCYQPRLSIPGVLGPRGKVGLHPDEVTIADLLKNQGYATMCIGKWHLGDRAEVLPTAQGFDQYFGLPYSNDMARISGWGNNPDDLDKIWKMKKWDIYQNHLYRDEERIEGPVNQVTLTDRYTAEALKFIRSNTEQPFFLYLPQTMPHVPLFVSDDRYQDDPHQAYRLTIEHIDWSVGQIMKELEALGIADNTIVVYTSDNGPWLSKNHHGGSAGELRAGKGTTYEGGMRVPGIVRWPGHIPAGTVTDEVASTIDLLPTLAEVTGATLPDQPIDGLSILANWTDPQAPSPHRTAGFFYYKNNRVEAVRWGQWKLHIRNPRPRNSKNAKKKAKADAPRFELYDLDADIGEAHDVAAEHPEVVHRIKSLAAQYDGELKAHQRPIWKAAD